MSSHLVFTAVVFTKWYFIHFKIVRLRFKNFKHPVQGFKVSDGARIWIAVALNSNLILKVPGVKKSLHV